MSTSNIRTLAGARLVIARLSREVERLKAENSHLKAIAALRATRAAHDYDANEAE